MLKVLLFLLCLNGSSRAKDVYIEQVRLGHKNCHVEYWCMTKKNQFENFKNWQRTSLSICDDWAMAIYYKSKLVIVGHFVGDDLCDWYDRKYKCYIINGYHVPIEIMGLDCAKEFNP